VLSHLLLDFITPYGTRLLLPFSNVRLAWGIFPVLDLWLLPMILFAMVLPFFFRLISSEIGAQKTSFRPAAIFVLTFLALLGGVRATAHRRVTALVDSFIYKGRDPVRASAFPESANPFRWHVVIDTESSLEEADVNVFEEFDPTATHSFYPPEPSRALDIARQTRVVQAFLDFAQYPYIYVDQRDEGYDVIFRDLRYEYGTMMLRKGAVARVKLDSNLQVVSQHFSFRDSGDVR
jgi:inner membrane protein